MREFDSLYPCIQRRILFPNYLFKKFFKKRKRRRRNTRLYFFYNTKRIRKKIPFLYFFKNKVKERRFFYRRRRPFLPKPKHLALLSLHKWQKYFTSLLFLWLYSHKNYIRYSFFKFLLKEVKPIWFAPMHYITFSFFCRFLFNLVNTINIKYIVLFNFLHIGIKNNLLGVLYLDTFLVSFKKNETINTLFSAYYNPAPSEIFVGEAGFVPIDGFYIYFNYLITKYFSFIANTTLHLFICKKPVRILSANDLVFLLFFIKQSRFFRFKFAKVFKLSDFFGLLFFSIRWLDWTWLLERIQQILSLIRIYRHKLFWRFFILLIKRYIVIYFLNSWIRGIYISIRGKIGVVGNSRKRRLFWHIGAPSPSYFTKSIYYKDTLFRTPTGAIGFKVWLIQ